MPTVKIDDKEYDVDAMSPQAKQQLQMLQFVEAELIRANAQIAMLQTARRAYSNALRDSLEMPEKVLSQETIKFS